VKLKKPTKLQTTVFVVVIVAVLAVFGAVSHHTADHGGFDSAAQQACSDFADGYPHAKAKSSRLALADKVMGSSQRTKNTDIKSRAAAMGRDAADGGTAWKNSAKALTNACHAAAA
jgi:hypothetical protein